MPSPRIVLLNETNSILAADGSPTRRSKPGARGPIAWVLGLFTSVRFGIVILTALFLYSTIGSAGIVYPVSGNLMSAYAWRHVMPRQWPAFEMTEFEWFHTPAFLVLCALLGLTIAVTTIRRIPLRIVNLGVWMIHTGVITLIIGSVVYFGTKVEGDAPVVRREVIARVGASEVRLPAVPGARRLVGSGADQRFVRVVAIDPQWPLLSGDDAGTRVFSVSVVVEPTAATTGGLPARYVRQLLDGYPQYTEDVIPGRGRAVKLEEYGERLIDGALELTLEPGTQSWYWIKDSTAIAVREANSTGDPGPWAQRIARGVPRYNDWLPDAEAAWPSANVAERSAVRPLSIDVPAGESPDALGDVSVRIIGFLRYAGMETRRAPGGDDPIPVVDLIARDPTGQAMSDRIALDREWRGVPAFGGIVEVRPDGWTPGTEVTAQSMASIIEVAIGGDAPASAEIDPADPEASSEAGIAIGDAGWRVRIDQVLRDIEVGQPAPVSLAVLRITTPEGASFTRWAFPDAAMTRDMEEESSGDPHAAVRDRAVDARIATTFRPGSAAAVVIAINPQGDIRAFQRDAAGAFTATAIRPGEPIMFGGGASIEVGAVSATSHAETRPVIVPPMARDRDADVDRVYAWVLAEFRKGDWSRRQWLAFSKYSFDDPEMEAAGLGRYEPVTVTLPDGRAVEVMCTRERRPLPNPVMLEEFVLTANVGGFTGDMSSIRDWTSIIRFDGPDGWSAPARVETNEPAAHSGLRFFQAYWDAPRDGSAGMAFTGLGVGNRQGVVLQLVGCIVAVIGMIYAFYVKPIIKRRRRDRVVAALAADGRTR